MSQNKIMFMSIYITNMQAGIFFMNTPTQYYRKYIQWAIYTFFFGSWSLSNSHYGFELAVDSDTLLILMLLITIEEPDGRSMSFEWICLNKFLTANFYVVFWPKMLLPHSDNHSFVHILEIALALIYQDGFVSDWTNDTSQVTLWKLMNHFMIV